MPENRNIGTSPSRKTRVNECRSRPAPTIANIGAAYATVTSTHRDEREHARPGRDRPEHRGDDQEHHPLSSDAQGDRRPRLPVDDVPDPTGVASIAWNWRVHLIAPSTG